MPFDYDQINTSTNDTRGRKPQFQTIPVLPFEKTKRTMLIEEIYYHLRKHTGKIIFHFYLGPSNADPSDFMPVWGYFAREHIVRFLENYDTRYTFYCFKQHNIIHITPVGYIGAEKQQRNQNNNMRPIVEPLPEAESAEELEPANLLPQKAPKQEIKSAFTHPDYSDNADPYVKYQIENWEAKSGGRTMPITFYHLNEIQDFLDNPDGSWTSEAIEEFNTMIHNERNPRTITDILGKTEHNAQRPIFQGKPITKLSDAQFNALTDDEQEEYVEKAQGYFGPEY